MQSTLPVIAAKAYFLQRFDWRVDELLKGDALLPTRAATQIAKVFKNDGRGLSLVKLTRLLFLDGWRIGFRRIAHFLMIARHPEDLLGLKAWRQQWEKFWARSQRRLWIHSSGQQVASSASGNVRWVGISLEKKEQSLWALQRALVVSKPGDTVLAVHYPSNMNTLVNMDLFPGMAGDVVQDISRLRLEVLSLVDAVVAEKKPPGVDFKAFVGSSSAYKPAYALCEDCKVADVKPYRVYIGYELGDNKGSFTDYVVRHAPCDVVMVKKPNLEKSHTRWVGMSMRNFDVSATALIKALQNSQPGDKVVALHYPLDPVAAEGLSSVFYDHYTSVSDPEESTVQQAARIADNLSARLLERVERISSSQKKDGVDFEIKVGSPTPYPHHMLVRDAKAMVAPPQSIYVGYTARRGRDRLVAPQKLYDVAEYIAKRAPCNV
eukprot:5808356-Amphidinium_carterae.1